MRRIGSIESTAYHEAGHVVAALAKRIKFKLVTIVPQEDGSPGCVHYCRYFFRHKQISYFTSDTFIRHGIITLAGICSERIKSGKYNWQGFGQDGEDGNDRFNAIELFQSADIYDATEYYSQTEKLLRKHWDKVETIASALLEKKTLSYDDVIALIENKLNKK